MKRVSIAFLAAILLLTGLNACKKYEDGPYLSFKSKYDRVVNTWKAKYVFRDEADYTAWFEDMVIELHEDGRFVVTDSVPGMDTIATQEGLWDLVNDDADIRFIFSKPPTNPDRKFYEILKLKEEELWMREVTDSVVWTFRLIPGTPPDTTQ